MKKWKHLLLIFLLLLSFLQGIDFTKAEDWDYYKEITISNFSADYQVKITCYYGSGTDGTNVVYLNSHCQTDFDDVQFRASDQTTVLKHWREEYTASTSATFWVKLPSSSQTIYIYYGNATATDSSDPDDVFIFYDDFQGSTLDTNKWTTGGEGTLEVYDGYVYASSFGTGAGWHGPEAVATFNSTTNFIIESRIVFDHYQSEDLGFNRIYLEDSSDWRIRYLISDSDAGATQYRKIASDQNYTYWDTGAPGSGSDGPHNWYLQRLGSNMVVKYDGVQKYNGTCTTDSIDRVKFMFWQYSTYNDIWMTVEYIKIRKYASPVPTFTFGSEQPTNQPPSTPTNSSPSNGATDQSLNPTLTWSAYEDPDEDLQQAYEVRVDNNSDMSTPEWTGTGGAGNSTTVNVSNGTFANDCSGQVELDENDTYYWDVRVQDDQNNWSNRSTATNFTTDEFSPTVTLVTPSDESTGISLNPLLQINYEDPNSDPIQNLFIIIDDNADFSSKEFWTGLLGAGAVTSVTVNTANGEFLNNCSGQIKLDPDIPYNWKAQVSDSTGRYSEWSGVFQFTTGSLPAAPTGCSASYISDSQIDLSWTDNSSNETGFKVYRSVDGGGYSLLTTEAENSTGSNDNSTSADHYYSYKISAYNDIGESSQCETSTVYTSPLAPSNVEASLNDTTITLTWTDNSNITDLHEIDRSIDGGEWSYLDEDSDGTFEDTWQESWTSVKYRIRAEGSGPRYSSYVESNIVCSNQAPVAAFVYWGSGGTEITFDARGSSDPDDDPLTFNWDLGNGDTAQGDFITYDYDMGGSWTVILTVSDGQEQDQIQKTVSINVSSGSSRPSAPSTPAEAVDEIFEIVGETAKETVRNAKDNDLTVLFVLIIVIAAIAAYKKR